jgi:hypothetical protein
MATMHHCTRTRLGSRTRATRLRRAALRMHLRAPTVRRRRQRMRTMHLRARSRRTLPRATFPSAFPAPAQSSAPSAVRSPMAAAARCNAATACLPHRAAVERSPRNAGARRGPVRSAVPIAASCQTAVVACSTVVVARMEASAARTADRIAADASRRRAKRKTSIAGPSPTNVAVSSTAKHAPYRRFAAVVARVAAVMHPANRKRAPISARPAAPFRIIAAS